MLSPFGSADAAPTPALDVAAGIERVMGDEAMYRRILGRFRSDYTGKVASLRDAIAAGDATLAHRLAHTLKGAAAMIEARALRALAMETEQILRAGLPADSLLLDRLEAQLARVIAQIDGLIAAPPSGSPGTVEAVLAEGDVTRLCALLDIGDSRAQDLMAKKRAGLCTRLGAARMAELESAVAAFDYERALDILRTRQERQAASPGASA
ncbi:Hpt domain-containing protein [Massilia sp. UMI-21]|nr:Hpt domain-containing protein [Massilia sp. UMI-21]